MEQLEIKHLAGYLPYGLKGYSLDYEIDSIIEMEGLYNFEDIYNSKVGDIPISCYKPILRPLSDLTKEIEVNGEKFVPATKMITHGFHNTYWYDLEEFDYRYLYVMDLEKLLEWHFDI